MGKARLKSSRKPQKYQTGRRGPSDDQEEYIRRVSQPKTGEDVALALQNPATEAYKQMMNNVNARKENSAILERLVQIFLARDYIAQQKEKDDIYKSLLARELIAQKEAFRFHENQIALATKRPVFIPEEKVLKKEIENYSNKISKLLSEILALELNLQALETKATVNTTKWIKIAEREEKSFVERIEKKNIAITLADGTRLTKDSPNYKAAISGPPGPKEDPAKVMDIVLSSKLMQAIEEHNKREAAKATQGAETSENVAAAQSAGVPAPPPPPPPKSKLDLKAELNNITMDAAAFSDAADFRKELKDITQTKYTGLTGAADENIGAAILKAMKANKELFQEKAAAAKETKAEKTEIAAEALQNRKDIIVQKAEIAEKKRELHQLEAEKMKAEQLQERAYGNAPPPPAPPADKKIGKK